MAAEEDPYLAKCHKIIEEVGWVAQGVIGDEKTASWVYSVGFVTFGMPEVAIVGLDPRQGTQLLHNVFAQRAIVAPARIAEEGLQGMLDGVLEGYAGWMRRCSNDDPDYPFSIAHRIHERRDFPAMQFVWPDAEGRFPWNDGWDTTFNQPLIAEA